MLFDYRSGSGGWIDRWMNWDKGWFKGLLSTVQKYKPLQNFIGFT
jgi:hypothetical protein